MKKNLYISPAFPYQNAGEEDAPRPEAAGGRRNRREEGAERERTVRSKGGGSGIRKRRGEKMEKDELFQLKGSILTIRVPAELDHHLADEIRKKAEELQSENQICQIDFDFGQTTFMDSSGIGLIMGRFREIQLTGGKVRAVHAGERIRKILKISGVARVIEIVPEKSWNI